MYATRGPRPIILTMAALFVSSRRAPSFSAISSSKGLNSMRNGLNGFFIASKLFDACKHVGK